MKNFLIALLAAMVLVGCGSTKQVAEPEPRSDTEPLSKKTINANELKLQAARAEGLDTTAAFRNEMATYRTQLLSSFVGDKTSLENQARSYYNDLIKRGLGGRLKVQHLFTYVPQNSSVATMRRLESRMDSLYTAVLAGADFDKLARDFSEEKEAFVVDRLDMPEEFESVVFRMNPGDVSKPFYTPQGIHIVKVLSRIAAPSFEEMKPEILNRILQSPNSKTTIKPSVELLKQKYHYQENAGAISKLLSGAEVSETLFSIEGRNYSGADFARFARHLPAGRKSQFENFVTKSILDYQGSQLEKSYPEIQTSLKKHEEEWLIREIMQDKVILPGKNAENLKDYFESHRNNYRWSMPRYEGIVVHCLSKQVMKSAKKALKRNAPSDWESVLEQLFNASGTKQVQYKKHLFEKGDDAYVDQAAFGMAKPEPMQGYPYSFVLGKVTYTPRDYKEIGPKLQQDYQLYLEELWLDTIRKN